MTADCSGRKVQTWPVHEDGGGIAFVHSASGEQLGLDIQADRLVSQLERAGRRPAMFVVGVGSSLGPLASDMCLQRLITELENRGLAWLAVTHLDRISRSFATFMDFQAELERLEVELLVDGQPWGNDPTREALLAMTLLQ